jgi:peptidoglycan/LPS O-acetylase OafA/YrhL
MGRAIAAIAVVAFHMSLIVTPRESLLAKLSSRGNVGVDFFFVLSGFIIFYAHRSDLSRGDRLPRYWWRRFIRVYPVYWIYTIGTIVIAILFASHNHVKLPNTFIDWIETFLLVRVNDAPMPIVSAWTLFYEVAFYFIFSLAIFNRNIGIAAVVVWSAILLILNRAAPINDPAGVWTSRLCLNFMFGMGACWLHTKLSTVQAGLAIGFGAVSLLIAGAFADQMPGDQFGYLLAASFTALVAGFAGLERKASLQFGMLTLLGDASYTIYLAHGHVEPLVIRGLKQVGAISPDALFVTGMLITLAICVGLYLIVEKPLLALLRRIQVN